MTPAARPLPAVKPLVDRVAAQLRAMRAAAVAPPPPRSQARRPR